jgi:CubicO group peptidase (beta-lactamase class C family)
LREVFRQNFIQHEEHGACLHISIGGEPMVDLWGGHCDRAKSRPWQRDTLVNAYSVGKGLLAILTLRLLEQRQLRLDTPVSRSWPDFAQAGKGAISLRNLLSHRAGLPALREHIDDDLAMYDWDLICSALARQEPYWKPGEDHGYHCNTLGFLVGEFIRRSTGESVERAFAREVSGPIGADFHFGLPASEHARVADVITFSDKPLNPEQRAVAFPPTGDAADDEMVWRTYFNPGGLSGFGTVNSPDWRASVIPSTSGHGNARSVSAIYDALLHRKQGGGDWIGDGLRRESRSIHSDGVDRILGKPSRFGLGFQLAQPTRPLGPNPQSFGHYGYGGSLGFADPEAGLSFAYSTNKPGARWQTPRTTALIDALYELL